MNVLAGILGVLTLISLTALTGFFLWRWEAHDINRWDRERRLARERLVIPAHPCAMRGHKYRLQVGQWQCVVCGDHVATDDGGGVA